MDIVRGILLELRAEFDFDSSENFVEDGYLDSFDIISLISEIEEKFQISIDGLDVVPENFVSYEAIAEMIKKNGGKI